MTTNKSQSSILILATIGVYFGLVLVGATPQVVAQRAAMARSFDISDEIEAKDDLDKKPNGCDLSPDGAEITRYETQYLWFNDRSIGEYHYLLEKVLEAFPEKIDAVNVRWRSDGELRPSRKVNGQTIYPFGFLDTDTGNDLEQDVLFVGNGLPGKSFTFSILRNSLGTQFRFESQQIPYDASLVRTLYSSALDRQRCSFGWTQDVILRHTELTIEGDHLVINTRLPRGSLETLLADAK